MSSKQNRSQEFKRAIDLGQVELASPTDLVKIWRIATGDEKAISLFGLVASVDRDILSVPDGNLADLEERLEAIEEDLYDDPKFVPYVGAVENVILGDFGLSTNHIIYDTTPVNLPTVQGSTYWDVDDNTIAVVLNGYVMKVGEDVFYAVKNQTGSTITKGTACGFAGTVGSSGRLLTKPYLANGVESSTFFMGVAAEEILDGEDGKVLWFGRIRGLNTNAFDEGDILYVSTSSAGGFQTTVPQAPNNIIQVAAVITKSTNQGTIFVRPTIGSNINKDEGVKIDTPLDGQTLIYNSTNGLFENDFAYPEAVERENNTVLFDKNYIIGNAAARTGNILFDFTGAKLGAWTEMRHADASAFTFPAEAKLMFDSADISTTDDNFFLFVLTKKSSTQIVKVFHAIEGGV
jgi:hypothetical protein